MIAGTVILVIMALYALFIFRLMRLWETQPPVVSEEAVESLTLVVVYRNESKNLPDLIKALNGQKGYHGTFEAIFVNDHSEDDSKEVLDELLADFPFPSKNLNLPDSRGTGKKAGLAYGISMARGEYIITTDADCTMGHHWLASMANNAMDFVSGPVRYHDHGGFWGKLVQLDLTSLIVLGAGNIANRKPNLANGANMMFKKSRYEELNGFEGNQHIPSGDDVFLVSGIASLPGSSIGFRKSQEAIVSTNMAANFREFIHQRLRWAGKTRYIATSASQRTTWFLLVSYLVFLCIPIVAFTYSNTQVYVLLALAFLVKFFADLQFFSKVTPFFKQQNLLKYVVFAEVVHPVYVVLIAFASLFVPYQWKNRKVKNG